MKSACKLNFETKGNSPIDAKFESFQQSLARELSKQGLEHSIPIISSVDIQDLQNCNFKDFTNVDKFQGLTTTDKEKIVKIINEIKEDEDVSNQMFHEIETFHDQDIATRETGNNKDNDDHDDSRELFEDDANPLDNFNLERIHLDHLLDRKININ